MIALRLLIALTFLACSACSLLGGGNKNGTARIYEGDSSPVINMTGEQNPGGPIR